MSEDLWTYYKLPYLDRVVRIHDNGDTLVIKQGDLKHRPVKIWDFESAPEKHAKIILAKCRKYCEELNRWLISYRA